MKTPLLELDRVSVTMQGSQALSDVSFSVHEGEHSALLGPNGAGKSTLLKVMRAECFPNGSPPGRILWYPAGEPESAPLAGRELCALVSIARTELYLRHQWSISGEELILSGLHDTPLLYAQADEKERHAARELAHSLKIADLLDADISLLSQSQLSMLLFAGARMRKTRLLLLDEFVDGLDARYRAILLAALEETARDTTLIVATHRPENLPPCVRRVIRMEEGAITGTGTLEAASSESGNSRQRKNPPRRTDRGRPVFSLKNADVYIESTPVLRNLNWEIYPGEHWALVGGAASGKSTLLGLLAGDHYPAAGGSIERVLPGASEPLKNLTEIRRHIRLVSGAMQATYAYNLSGEEFVCSGREGSIGLYHTPAGKERAEARACLERVDALHLADRPIRSLSTGQLRRLLLARALVGAPKILLLDDPFAGLDVNSRARVQNLLSNLLEAQGVQIIMTTASLRDLLPQTAYTALLEGGRLKIT